MPLSNDNQDYGQSDEKNKKQQEASVQPELTTDDLKGKKVDADVERESEKPVDQTK